MAAPLLDISLSDLSRIIDRRKRDLRRLTRERRRVARTLNKIDREISRLGGAAIHVSGRGRIRNPEPLTAVIETVLKKARKPLPVSQILDQVLRSGYRSSSGNFRAVVNLTLIKDGRFVKADRGVYMLKKARPVRPKKKPGGSKPTSEKGDDAEAAEQQAS